jgi:hypothetical protein
MKVIVVNAYVRENASDTGVPGVCLRQVREAFSGARIQVVTREGAALQPNFDGNLRAVWRQWRSSAPGWGVDLGLEDWALPVAEVTHQNLMRLVQRLQADRQVYVQTLTKRLPGYVSCAEQFPELLRCVMSGRRLPSTVEEGILQ